MAFDANKVKQELVAWLRNWFEENGKGCNAVVGISGGKDSSVTAALCVEALGVDRVYGVMMPNGVQSDLDVAQDVCKTLGIHALTVNIKGAFDAIINEITPSLGEVTTQTTQNLPARLRMSTLYAVGQSVNGRVINTCNLSEDWVGYSTRYGDSAGDVSPLGQLTVTEVRLLGTALGLPDRFVQKPPIDGLSGKTDEDNLGFTYAVLDRYIREGICEDEAIKANIDERHRKNLFKMQFMPIFPYQPQK